MKTIAKHTLYVLFSLLPVCQAMPADAPRGVPLELWYDEPAVEWMTSALPLGNGDLGAMFFGGVARERIQFNEKSLWSGSTEKRGTYRNFGNIYLDFLTPDTCSSYRRSLSLDEGMGRVSYTIGGVRYEREYFASHADSVIVMRLSTPGNSGLLNLDISMTDGDGRMAVTGDGMLAFSGRLDLLSYEAQAVVRNDGGTLAGVDGRLMVRGADAVTVVLAAATDFCLPSPTYTRGGARGVHAGVSGRVERACAMDYGRLRQRHMDDYVSIINAPTADKPYERMYTVSYLGNIKGGRDVAYLNLPAEELKRMAIAQMKDGNAVWFGSDVGQSSSKDGGLMDLDVHDVEDLFSTEFTMDKAQRLDYGESLMTHAMVLTGVNLNEEGKPNRWRVENSWGKDAGKDGYYVMTDRWFDEYTYQVVVNKKYLTDDQRKLLETEPIVLKPWDPMGSLAR